jgi:peptide/nickel transport system substrate-binding protein
MLATAIALLALVVGCGPPQGNLGDAAAQGGAFVYPLPTEPATLNFVSGTDQYSVLVQRLVGDGLVDHDRELAVVPRLAESWEFSDDGLVLTFHLRSGVRFHDGAPFTSADVLYTYERLIDPESHAVGRLDSFLPVVKVEAPDPATVRVTYREPYAPALRAWSVAVLPSHLYRGDELASSPYNRAPVGTGPFRFVSWEPGQRIVLEANPEYWGGRPQLDTFVLQIVPSQETRLQALLAGEIDFAGLTPAQWEAYGGDAAFLRRFRVIRSMPLFHYYIAWRGDGSNPFFTDASVRRALSMALNRNGYVGSVLRGRGEVAHSPFHPMVPGTGEPLPAIPHDPEGAADLLDAAGWRIDPGSGLRTRDGVPFRFTLLVFTGGTDHLQFSQVAQENLRRLGIEMNIQRLDWQALLARLRSGRFEAALSGMMPGLDPDSVYGMLHSSQIEGGQNYAAFSDQPVDRWLEEARRTLDLAARAGLYARVNERVRDQEPYSFLFYPISQGALARRFEDVHPSPQGILGYFPGAARFRVAAQVR